MKEAFETCTFCHRQALMAEAFRAENEELKREVAGLRKKLRSYSHPTVPTSPSLVPSSPGKDAA